MRTATRALAAIVVIGAGATCTMAAVDLREHRLAPLATQASPMVWAREPTEKGGCFEGGCSQGQFAMAIPPFVGLNDELLIAGQRELWRSNDGRTWASAPKTDWGPRAGMSFASFGGRLWMFGGAASTDDLRNDIWTSFDGLTWVRVVDHAEWSPRRNHNVVAFGDRLWLLGGTGHSEASGQPTDQVHTDIWSSTNGIVWALEDADAPWGSRDGKSVLIHQDKMWILGGRDRRDVWSSDDGRNWRTVTTQAAWPARQNGGSLVYRNELWVFGGRGLNDAWRSTDGRHWREEAAAPWSTRTANYSIVFRDKIWLFSGKTGREDSWDGVVWSLAAVDRSPSRS